MQVEVELKHYAGWCKGVWKTEPLDVVLLHRKGRMVKVGHIRRMAGAMLLFCRFIPDKELRRAILDAVIRARAETDMPAAPFAGSPPNPEEAKAYMRGEVGKKRRRKTFLPILDSEGKPIRKASNE